jgi:hypothetical protein
MQSQGKQRRSCSVAGQNELDCVKAESVGGLQKGGSCRQRFGLKQEAPEEQDAQQQDERDDDNLNQAHNGFLFRVRNRLLP